MANDRGLAPETRKDLQSFIGMRLVPKYDAWGCEYDYESNGGAFTIYSRGPDGKIGTPDDIIVKVAELAEHELPINRKLTKLRRDVVDKRKALNEYKNDFIPSICGYAFGERAKNIAESEFQVSLTKPFRKCREAILRYEGSYDPRLVMVCLLARFGSSESHATQSEGLSIIKMLERNYSIKMSIVQNGECFVSSYRGNGMEITVRNDMMLHGDSDHLILSVMFCDTRLPSMFRELDDAVACLEECEKGQHESMPGIPTEKETATVDDEGLDVLTGFSKGVGASSGKSCNDADKNAQVPPGAQLEELRTFRDQMQKMREEIRQRKEAASRRRAGNRKSSGIIESKGEGPVISTGDGVRIR